MNYWYQLAASDVLRQFRSDAVQGLSLAEVQRRLVSNGTNTLDEAPRKQPWQILWAQVSAPLVVMLIIAAIISLVIGDTRDAIAILAIVVLNAALGVRQEYKAEQAMAALKRLAVPTVRVRRSAQIQEVSAQDLVPGDVIMVEAGNLVPADGRLLESSNLQVQEASLTGESEPVEKDATIVFEAEQPLGDRRNMVYRGTFVTRGRGTLVITETAMQTELGHIAQIIQGIAADSTPLQKRLSQLGKVLGLVALAIALMIFLLGWLRGEAVQLMLLTAVSVAVAAVPEGLPAVVTIALALGAERMLKRHALIRNLPAVETLGSVTTICSDKTGTLTENRMTVTVLDVAEQRIDLVERLDRKRVTLKDLEATTINFSDHPALLLLLLGGALCNDASLELNAEDPARSYRAIGNPTETALVVAAAKVGLLKHTVDQAFPRIAEIPFDSTRKRMTTCHRCTGNLTNLPAAKLVQAIKAVYGEVDALVFSKGAIDSLLTIVDHVWIENRIELLDDRWREQILASHDQLAQDGLRVLGVAYRPQDLANSTNQLEQNLTFIGFVGMLDPARPEVQEAIKLCQGAGIRVVMITGDHPLTAHHIASDLGITRQGKLLTGQALSRLTAAELAAIVETVEVYARVSPEDKLKIVKALQQLGHVVAMTGDGVNDAPALKQAEIGVAMGITGTDVSKEAADIVLQNDNFATIVAAVQEGRVIYDNIRKFIQYTLTGNAGQLWLLFLAPFLGMPLPLTPIQILWINLIADGLLAVALSFESAEPGIMQRPPYPPRESIFARGLGRDIVWVGLLLGLVLLGVAYGYWANGLGSWQTMVFSTLAFSRIGLAETVRSAYSSVSQLGLLSNSRLLGAVILTLTLQLAIIYLPALQTFFGTIALSRQEIAIALILSTLSPLALELKKQVVRPSY